MLIIVLFILTALALISLDLNRSTLLDHSFSHSVRANLGAKPLLASGESLAARFLVRDFQNSPEIPESIEAKNRRFKEWLTEYNNSIKHADLNIIIEDENARFPLRAIFPNNSSEKVRAERYIEMLENIIAHLLVAHGYEKGEDEARIAARHYIAELLAWGGEKPVSDEAMQWYLNRNPPYIPPGHPPESVAELALVYWPDVEDTLAKKVLLGDSEMPGLAENCSLWSRGPININTILPVTGWGLSSNFQTALSFMEAIVSERKNHGDKLPGGWENDIFSARGVIRPPANILSSSSRWYRTRTTVRTGAAKTGMESVGWFDKTHMNWICRNIL